MKKILFLLFLPSTLKAQKDYSAMLDNFMNAEVTVNNFNGNVLVAKNGNVIYQKSFGYRNYDTKELLDNNSAFELASITKQFTAMGILLLEQERKLSLSDTLRKFFPELPYYNITIKNMLTHTSGIPDYMDSLATEWRQTRIASNKDVIEFLSEKKLPAYFEPGKQWRYSDAAYELLASIIEKVSGQSFKDFMEKNIFHPLQMNYSQVYIRRATNKIISDYAFGYIYSDSANKYILPDSANFVYFNSIYGAEKISSTTADLYKWDRALKNNTLLQKGKRNYSVPLKIAVFLNFQNKRRGYPQILCVLKKSLF